MGRRAWLLLLVLATLWGSSYMLIKVALTDLDPVAIVFFRTLLATLVLAPLAIARGAVRPLAAVGWTLALAAVVQIAGPFLLITVGEQHISSAVAGILVSSGPMFSVLLALGFDPDGQSQGWALIGVVMGMAGVVLLFVADLSGDAGELLGGLAVLAASLGYAAGSLLVRRRCRQVPPIGVAAATMTLATLALLPAVPLSLPAAAPGVDAVLAILVLGAGSTGVAFLIVYTLIAGIGPTRAALATYIAPGFAVAYGAILLGERVSTATVAGLVLVIAGAFLGAEGRLPWRRRVVRAA